LILADTSVWVDHFRSTNRDLQARLEDGDVACHPFVRGELACGNLRARASILGLLGNLPALPLADDAEVLELIEARNLMGRGLGWIDVHLLASCAISSTPLWTLDKPLARAAQMLRIAAQ
jgi:predicted nucleic acid-binding protein